MKPFFRHLSSLIAPLVMGILLPGLILLLEHPPRLLSPSIVLIIIGSVLFLAGLCGMVACIRLFIRRGEGTIMPWDPTRRLLIAGLYRHVRNPMILSLILLQVGEALLFASWGIALLALLNFLVNTVYFIFSEEPGLKERFGDEYVEYTKHVRRWIPRLRPWLPGGHINSKE